LREFTLINQKTHSNFFLRKSAFSQDIDRYFFKIDALFSYMGGFASIFIGVCSIFAIIYNKT